MKRKIYSSTLVVLFSVVLVVVFHKTSNQPNMTENGFNRKYLPSPKVLKQLNFPDSISYINGIDKSRVYCTGRNPSILISFDASGSDIQVDNLHLPSYLKSPIVTVVPPDIFVFHGRRNSIYHLSMGKPGYDSILVPGPIFTKALYIGGSKFVLRQFISGIKDQSLVIFNSYDKSKVRNDSINDFYYDSGMLAEGKLNYDKTTAMVTYVYNRANKILILDTSLRLLRTGSTIDTNVKPLLSQESVKGHVLPAYIYNKASTLFGGRLYVYSKLKADNETKSAFQDSCNIDIYDLETTKYLGSFHLPKLKGISLNSFQVTGNLLIAAYHDNVTIYNL